MEATTMRAAIALVGCVAGLGGCSGVGGMATGGERRTLDPSTIYLATFEQVETTREDADRYACLNGAPLVCQILSHTLVECACPL